MKVLVYGMGLYALAFLIHLVVWKIRMPKSPMNGLLQIFSMTLGAGYLGIRALGPSFSLFQATVPQSLPECLHMGLLYLSLTLAYMVLYSALEADSPSVGLLRKIISTGAAGMGEEDLRQAFNNLDFLEARIRQLAEDKLITGENGKLQATRRGLLLLKVISLHRELCALPKGG